MSRHHPHQARFVTACQQLLVLAVICAALTPAAKVMSLDLVPEAPAAPRADAAADGSGGGRVLSLSGYATQTRRTARGVEVVSTPQPVSRPGRLVVAWSGRGTVDALDAVRVAVARTSVPTPRVRIALPDPGSARGPR